LRLTHADQRYGTLAKLDRQAGIGMFSREPRATWLERDRDEMARVIMAREPCSGSLRIRSGTAATG
jgi:hypothetical protein